MTSTRAEPGGLRGLAEPDPIPPRAGGDPDEHGALLSRDGVLAHRKSATIINPRFMCNTEIDRSDPHIGRIAAVLSRESHDKLPEQVADEQLSARCEVNVTHRIAPSLCRR
jgi:hypothetical protein